MEKHREGRQMGLRGSVPAPEAAEGRGGGLRPREAGRPVGLLRVRLGLRSGGLEIKKTNKLAIRTSFRNH